MVKHRSINQRLRRAKSVDAKLEAATDWVENWREEQELRMEINKPLEIRKHLGLTPTQAGQIFLGHKPKSAYDVWAGIENGTRKMSIQTARYFDVLYFLVLCRDHNTHGSDQAIDRIVELFIG